MMTQERIEQLEAFDGHGAPVLSVYLDLDPASQVRRSYRTAFEDMVKAARDRLDDGTRTALDDEAARVHTWLESQAPQGKGLAIFSCAARGLWQADFLAVRVMNHLAFEPKPDVAPLLEVVDEHERYAVAVIDKGRARLLVVFAGSVEDRQEFSDEVVGKHDQGGWSQSHYQRHHELHVHWHLKRVAQRLAELHRRRRFDRLLLAGPVEATTQLRHLLPRPLAARLAAVVPAEVSASDAEILEKTAAVEREVERAVEERLLGQLLDLAGPAGPATVGVAPTLAALWADMVQTLVVAHGLHEEGSECPNCGRLDPGRVEACPTCGHTEHPVHDVFHRAMGRAVEQAGRVEVMHGAAARRLVEVGGGLGALLRYPSPVPQVTAASAGGPPPAPSTRSSGSG
jgi:peptide subunit release factor 1 (eRF1)